MARQIRVEGRIEKLSKKESEAYFQSRERGRRIGAWASPQSREIADRETLERIVSDTEKRFEWKRNSLSRHLGRLDGCARTCRVLAGC